MGDTYIPAQFKEKTHLQPELSMNTAKYTLSEYKPSSDRVLQEN